MKTNKQTTPPPKKKKKLLLILNTGIHTSHNASASTTLHWSPSTGGVEADDGNGIASVEWLLLVWGGLKSQFMTK